MLLDPWALSKRLAEIQATWDHLNVRTGITIYLVLCGQNSLLLLSSIMLDFCLFPKYLRFTYRS